jgi:hypothetical protein
MCSANVGHSGAAGQPSSPSGAPSGGPSSAPSSGRRRLTNVTPPLPWASVAGYGAVADLAAMSQPAKGGAADAAGGARQSWHAWVGESVARARPSKEAAAAGGSAGSARPS